MRVTWSRSLVVLLVAVLAAAFGGWAPAAPAAKAGPPAESREAAATLEERLIELAGFVQGTGFTIAATAERFGPRTPTHLSHTVRFAPRDPLFRVVDVRTYKEEPVSLGLRFAQPVTVDAAPLVAAFGEPEELPRVHYDDPVPWQFDLPAGWLILVSTSDDPEGPHEVSSVRIRRRPSD